MKKIIVKNPSDNFKIIDKFDQTTFQEVDVKVASARKAFATWSLKTVAQRVALLQPLLQKFTNKRDDIAYAIAIEMGMPISVCQEIDIEVGLQHIQGYLENAELWLSPDITYEDNQEIHTLYFEPFGIIGISIAWNYPFTNFVWAIFQHLLVGNVVVLKHSENCVLVTKLLEQIVQEIPEVAQVCQFVYGFGDEAGNYLIHSDVDALWFVGSTQTGSLIYQTAAKKMIPAILELGGSAPAIVCEDADIDKAVLSIYNSRFLNNGQTCDGVKRLIVHESIVDEVVQKLIELIQQKKVGIAINKDTDLGPLVHQKQIVTLQEQVADALSKGAQILVGGKQLEGLQGAYYEPTVLQNISFDMKVWREEVFGPVLPVVSFKSANEAIELANNTQYGLGGYIYTKNKDSADIIARSLQTGSISVNGANYVIPYNPFGGYKQASGFGRIHGKEGIRSLSNMKVIALKK